MNIERFWDGLLAVLDHAVDENLVRPENNLMVLVASTPEGILNACRCGLRRSTSRNDWFTTQR